MVTLKNVTKIDNILAADYFPEDRQNDLGHIEYNILTGKIENIKHCEEDEKSFLKPYSHKSVLAIKEILGQDTLPKNYTYMWY